MAAGPGDSERLTPEAEGRRRFPMLLVVLIVQLLVATVFIVLVVTDSLPIPGGDGRTTLPAKTTPR